MTSRSNNWATIKNLSGQLNVAIPATLKWPRGSNTAYTAQITLLKKTKGDKKKVKLFKQVNKVQILIGSQNPFGDDCSSVIGKYHLKNKKSGLFIILGPKRMDYNKNLALVEYIKNSLTKV